MAGFPKHERQKIIDEYLASTGQNMFVPSAFIDWLADRPDHIAYPWFYAKDDSEAAREYRIGMARQMASGLRITTQVSVAPKNGKVVSVEVREFPALVSPVAGRHSGGGYQPLDLDDVNAMSELKRQGATALRSWLARYRGVAETEEIDVSSIEEIAAKLDGRENQSKGRSSAQR